MKIEFENKNLIETIDTTPDNTRSKRAEEYIRYFKKYPASWYIRDSNIKLHWYQRLILSIMDIWYGR